MNARLQQVAGLHSRFEEKTNVCTMLDARHDAGGKEKELSVQV